MRNTKVLSTLAVVAAFAVLAPSAFAETATVTTKVNLTSKCRWQGGSTTGPTVIVDFGAYTAFQTTANTGTAPTVVFECTRGYGTAPTVSWDGDAAGGGTIAGLNYTLSVSAQNRSNGTAADASSIGTPDTVTYTLGGTMPADQAGEGNGGATTGSRTLTVAF